MSTALATPSHVVFHGEGGRALWMIGGVRCPAKSADDTEPVLPRRRGLARPRPPHLPSSGPLYEVITGEPNSESAIQVPKSLFARHLSVAVLVPCWEGLCVGNPELVAPHPKKKYRDRLGCGTYKNGTYNRFLQMGKEIATRTVGSDKCGRLFDERKLRTPKGHLW